MMKTVSVGAFLVKAEEIAAENPRYDSKGGHDGCDGYCDCIGLVIGAEGSGVSRLVREKCDMVASIPLKGEIDSLNASVAMGVLAYEIVRQREWK